MAYTLYGSLTSPFVRRIRMLLNDIPFEMVEWNIYETDDGLKLNKINPVNQVPVFSDGDTTIWDSRQIFYYLNEKHHFYNHSWDQENMLTAIEGATSSAITLFLMKRSGMSITEPFMFVNRQKDRIESVFTYLKPFLGSPILKDWNFHSMTLYSFLDWAQFRGIITLDQHPELKDFLNHHKDQPHVKNTEIPKV